MNERLRIEPDEPFPEDLEAVPDQDLQVLNSKVERQLDHESIEDGEPQPETEIRHYELSSELDARDATAGD